MKTVETYGIKSIVFLSLEYNINFLSVFRKICEFYSIQIVIIFVKRIYK